MLNFILCRAINMFFQEYMVFSICVLFNKICYLKKYVLQRYRFFKKTLSFAGRLNSLYIDDLHSFCPVPHVT